MKKGIWTYFPENHGTISHLWSLFLSLIVQVIDGRWSVCSLVTTRLFIQDLVDLLTRTLDVQSSLFHISLGLKSLQLLFRRRKRLHNIVVGRRDRCCCKCTWTELRSLTGRSHKLAGHRHVYLTVSAKFSRMAVPEGNKLFLYTVTAYEVLPCRLSRRTNCEMNL